jgi:dolichol-phosphate mannosyltransferase
MRHVAVFDEESVSPVHLSVVIPVFGCRDCLAELHRRLVRTLERLVPSFEIVLVNDASPDGAWSVVEELAEGDRRVRGIDFSRNFGQHYALTAGLDRAQGQWTVVMDCDLPHPPEEIERLYRKALEGHDIVIGRRAGRRDPAPRRVASRLFSWIHAALTGAAYDAGISNFSIISRQVLRELRRLGERDRAYTSLLQWVGFDVAVIDFAHADRFAGRTSYRLAGLVRFAIDSLVSHSGRPLRFSVGLGALLVLGSFLGGVWLGYGALRWHAPAPGWGIVLVTMCLLAGLLFLNLGVLGLYLGKLFEQARGRPLYVVRRTLNLESPPDEEDAAR